MGTGEILGEVPSRPRFLDGRAAVLSSALLVAVSGGGTGDRRRSPPPPAWDVDPPNISSLFGCGLSLLFLSLGIILLQLGACVVALFAKLPNVLVLGRFSCKGCICISTQSNRRRVFAWVDGPMTVRKIENLLRNARAVI